MGFDKVQQISVCIRFVETHKILMSCVISLFLNIFAIASIGRNCQNSIIIITLVMSKQF